MRTHAFALQSVCGLTFVFLAGVAAARPPEIRNLDVRGLQIGAATKLSIDGADLLPEPKFFLDDQLLDVQLDAASTPSRLIVTVSLPATSSAGAGQFRIATIEGFSKSVPVGLDAFPQLPIAPELAAVNVALHGSVPGSGVSKTSFSGKAGDELIVEVEARRLGSRLRPVIHLYDSRRVQLAWALPRQSLSGDARLSVKLPADDKYAVEIHDSQYAPPGPSFFRMKIGRWQFADLAFPPAIPRGQEVAVELLGNVPGLRASLNRPGRGLFPIPTPDVTSGFPPSISVSELPELIEAAAQPMTLPSLPVAVSGRLDAAGQMDRFLLPVTAGTKLSCEIFAERIGSCVDAVVELRNQQGSVLAANDDGPNSTDPKLEFTVPADLAVLEVAVRDQLDSGRADAIYRLVIADGAKAQPDFEVVVKADAINAPAGETPVLEAFVTRHGYDGPIVLKAEGLPPGMQMSNVEIPAGANGTLLSFPNAGETASHLVTRLIATTPDGAIERPVLIETASDDRTPAWMRERISLAATPKVQTPFQIAHANESGLSQLVLSSKPAIPVRITRPSGLLGPVRLSLITSQPTPKLNGQPNAALAVRAPMAVEVPVDNAVLAAANALATVDKQRAEAVQQAQAAQGDAKVAADAKVKELEAQRTAAEAVLHEAEAKAVYQTDYAVIVPSQLGTTSCDLSLRAELLNPERNQVLRTAYLPVKRLAVVNPLVIKLAGPTTIETALDPATGATIKLTAKIERLAGYQGDVTVAVTGLPPGVTAANAVVKADQTDFATEIKVPANFAGTEISAKLTATGPPDPLSGNIPVKSEEADVIIQLKPATK